MCHLATRGEARAIDLVGGAAHAVCRHISESGITTLLRVLNGISELILCVIESDLNVKRGITLAPNVDIVCVSAHCDLGQAHVSLIGSVHKYGIAILFIEHSAVTVLLIYRKHTGEGILEFYVLCHIELAIAHNIVAVVEVASLYVGENVILLVAYLVYIVVHNDTKTVNRG